jgi:hypothetical protein
MPSPANGRSDLCGRLHGKNVVATLALAGSVFIISGLRLDTGAPFPVRPLFFSWLPAQAVKSRRTSKQVQNRSFVLFIASPIVSIHPLLTVFIKPLF